jgi:RNA polymerase sigma-70 factor (ECF subfamily)
VNTALDSSDRQPSAEDAVLARIVRREAGLIVAQLERRLGNFDVAEEAVQEAVVIALRTWRRDGVPANPGGWLSLTARHRAIDLLRKRSREVPLAEEWDGDSSAAARYAQPTGDVRLPMLFGCCHPALGVEARLALTLRAVVGMTTQQIASAFLVPEATMAQRLVRAKRKITSAGIPFTIPLAADLAPRLDDVLTVIYLSYNAGYLEPGAPGRELSEDAIWLSELVARAMRDQAEAWGLLALLTFLSSRTNSRFDDHGRLVLLKDQDRARWDEVAISRADGYLATAAALGHPGRFQLQAAIAGCHANATSWEETDWLQILTLYDLLLRFDSSPVIRLNHAIALSHLRGAAAALAEVDQVADRLSGYHLLHATRAQLLTALGDHAAARVANERALALTHNPAEQQLLRSRLEGSDLELAGLAAELMMREYKA